MRQQNVGLIIRQDGDHIRKVFAGTEHLLTYPHLSSKLLGVQAFGTIVVQGHESLICYKAGMEFKGFLADAGWRTVGQGMYYCYVTRGDLRSALGSKAPDSGGGA